MHCPACHRVMMSASSHVIEDETGAVMITRWRCRPCHETAEEIWLHVGYRGPDPTRIRYAVAPLRQRQTSVARRSAAKRETHGYVDAI